MAKSVRNIIGIVFIILFWHFATKDKKPAPPPVDTSLAEVGQEVESDGKWPPAPKEQVLMADNMLAANYLIMLDVSGSMGELVCDGNETKIDAAKTAVKMFQRVLDPVDNIGLYTFGTSIREVLPLGRYAPDIFDKSVDGLWSSGGTPLVKALKVSDKVLTKAAQTQGGYGTYHLILITDGRSSDGDPVPSAMDMVRKTAITINAVGFCTGVQHSLNIKGYTDFSTADNAEQLEKSLTQSVKAEQDVFDVSDFNLN